MAAFDGTEASRSDDAREEQHDLEQRTDGRHDAVEQMGLRAEVGEEQRSVRGRTPVGETATVDKVGGPGQQR